MSTEGTANALATMLDSDDFAQQVATGGDALSKFDLDEREKTMLQAAAAEGIQHIFRPESDKASETGEISDEQLEAVAGGGTGVASLSGYLNSGSISAKTQTALNKAIFKRYGTRASGDLTMAINL